MPSQRRFSDHLNSPYSRTPQSPHHSRISRTPKKAPGSIFGKVKQMFSPTVWLSNNEQANHNENSILEESDISTVSVFQEPPRSLNTPSNPFNEFKRLQKSQNLTNDSNPTDSPNVKLAKFFANKGAEPLSEIELEGVQALLSKSQSVVNSPRTPKKSVEDENETDISFDNRLLSTDTSKHALNITPSFKATYNTSITSEDSDTSNISSISNFSTTASVFKRRVFDYSDFPSPYRTARLKNYFSTNDLRSHQTSIKSEVNSSKEETKPETKKLSKTATALLSFIDNPISADESSKTEIIKEKEISKFQDFSNPYASHKKSKKPLTLNKKQSAIEQLEKTLNSDNTLKSTASSSTPTSTSSASTSSSSSFVEPPIPAVQQKPQNETLNKYKPIKSSSLRESISLNDESDDSAIKDVSLVKENEDINTNINNSSNSIPKFSFGSTIASKPDEPPQSVFSFGKKEETKKDSSNEEKAKPINLFTFGSTAPIVSAKTSSTLNESTQSIPLFNSNAKTEIKNQEKPKPIFESQSIKLKESNGSEPASTNQSKSFSSSQVFVFPEASKVLGFTIKDVDVLKYEKFKEIFKF